MHTSNRASPSSSPSKLEAAQNNRRNASTTHRTTHANSGIDEPDWNTTPRPKGKSSDELRSSPNAFSTSKQDSDPVEKTTVFVDEKANILEKSVPETASNHTPADIRQKDSVKSKSLQANEPTERHAPLFVQPASPKFISPPLKKRISSLRWTTTELQSQAQPRPQGRNNPKRGTDNDSRLNHINIDINIDVDIEALTYYPASNSSGKQRRKRRRIGDCNDSESEDPEFVVGSEVKKTARRRRSYQRKPVN